MNWTEVLFGKILNWRGGHNKVKSKNDVIQENGKLIFAPMLYYFLKRELSTISCSE